MNNQCRHGKNDCAYCTQESGQSSTVALILFALLVFIGGILAISIYGALTMDTRNTETFNTAPDTQSTESTKKTETSSAAQTPVSTIKTPASTVTKPTPVPAQKQSEQTSASFQPYTLDKSQNPTQHLGEKVIVTGTAVQPINDTENNSVYLEVQSYDVSRPYSVVLKFSATDYLRVASTLNINERVTAYGTIIANQQFKGVQSIVRYLPVVNVTILTKTTSTGSVQAILPYTQTNAPIATTKPDQAVPVSTKTYATATFYQYQNNPNAYIGKNITLYGLEDSLFPSSNVGVAGSVQVVDPYQPSQPSIIFQIGSQSMYTAVVNAMGNTTNPVQKFLRVSGVAVGTKSYTSTNAYGTRDILIPTIKADTIEQCLHGTMGTTVLTGAQLEQSFTCTSWSTLK